MYIQVPESSKLRVINTSKKKSMKTFQNGQ